MKARELRDYFISHADWLNPADTVDTFKHGDPDVEVRSVAVTWMLTLNAIDKVRSLGANLVVTHEPTFWDHFDNPDLVKNDPLYAAKLRKLDQAGLTVLRLHDTWDTWPKIGIGPSLASTLDLTEIEGSDRYRKGRAAGVVYHERAA